MTQINQCSSIKASFSKTQFSNHASALQQSLPQKGVRQILHSPEGNCADPRALYPAILEFWVCLDVVSILKAACYKVMVILRGGRHFLH